MPIKKQEEKEERPVDIKQERRRFQRSFEGLLKQLSFGTPIERRWAARDLADYKEASKHLLDQLLKEEDISVREAIISSLLKIGDEIAIQGLIECLRSDDAHLRNSAIEALKFIPEKVGPHIEKLLKDEDPDVRIFAVNILESLRHPKVVKWLIEVLEKDENVNVCGTALDLLAEVGTEEAVPAIKKVKERFKDEPYIQFAADVALKRINASSNNC
ncbi:MAG: HEAT repeat domain-containing protein [Thermodesulfobacterium sp.]|jgi:HEAT repeat protein|nr:HEAT repeat domain-containing protein [Thermodesulfobacterium sp.]